MLAFPGVTSYPAQSASTAVQASGTGSLVDLSHLATLAGGTYINVLSVNALAGGKVDLSNLNNYTTGATHFAASGTASTIDLSKLTGLLSDALYDSSLQASGGGTILDPLLATLNRTDVTTDGTGTLGTAQISTYTGGTITANGGTPDYSGLTALSGANLYANNGAVLAFPGVTSYPAQSASTTVQASGTGSLVDLSHLTTLAGGTYIYVLSVNALAGGKVDLSHLNNYTTGATAFTANGTANSTPSTIDLSLLTGLLSDAYYNSSLQATNGGTILDPILATLNRTNLTTDGTGALGTAQISTYTGGTITANGGTPDYSGLTALSGANLYANNGAVLAFPGVTSYPAQSARHHGPGQRHGQPCRPLAPDHPGRRHVHLRPLGQRPGRRQGRPEPPEQLHHRGHLLHRQRHREHHRPLAPDRTALGYLLQLLTPGQWRRHHPRSTLGHAQPHQPDHRRHRHAGHRPDQHLHQRHRHGQRGGCRLQRHDRRDRQQLHPQRRRHRQPG